MTSFLRSVILYLGPAVSEVFGVLATAVGVNFLTADAPRIPDGVLLIVGGVCMFITSRAVGDLFAYVRNLHRKAGDDDLTSLLRDNSKEYLGALKTWLWVIGFVLCSLGMGGRLGILPAGVPHARGIDRGGGSTSATSVRLATSKNLWCALSLIAIDQGMFTAEGLDIRQTYQLAGRQNMDALVSKSAEIANIVEVNHAYQALNGNTDLAVIGSIVAARDFAVVSKRSSKIQGPKDLVGRTLAFAPGTGAEMFVFALLKENNIRPDAVKLKRVQPAALVDAIASGDVDAAASWEPFVSSMKTRLGSDAVEVETGSPFVGVMNVAVRREWLQQNRDTAARFLRALDRAARLVRQRPSEAQAIVARSAGLDMKLVQSIWDRFDLTLSLDKAKQAELLRFVLDAITSNEREYAGRKRPEVDAYFHDDLVKEVLGK